MRCPRGFLPGPRSGDVLTRAAGARAAAVIRPLRVTDLDRVAAVQAACYPPAMQEPAALLAGRLRAAPDACWVAEDAEGVCAYLYAYRSRLGGVTALGGAFHPDPAADCLYLHDLAVDPRAAGRGLASGLARHALAEARRCGLAHAALVAVRDAAPFWARLGFHTASPGSPDDARRLADYPPPACYLTRRL